jgi:aspartyl-tRNA(Asn)/glutamyl-tRNA(Gln) amidotransferase subunit B
MEEDAGKSIHDALPHSTALDLNRAGTPLLEVVSEPDMRSAAEAVAYAKALYDLVTWLDICDGNLQEGSFRMDANVSVRRFGDAQLGTRREIKNLNSFRNLKDAIESEARWQIEHIEDGLTVQQATVLFNANTLETKVMRTKEDAHDYRYFADPDLPPVVITDAAIADIQQHMPELPKAMAERFIREWDLSPYDAALMTQSLAQATYFEAASRACGQGKLVANWINGEIASALNKDNLPFTSLPITAKTLAALIDRITDNTLSNKMAKKVFEALWLPENQGATPDAIIEKEGLKQVDDIGLITQLVNDAMAANPKAVEEFKQGNEKALNALAGAVMKQSKGKANPSQVQQILRSCLQ